MNRSECGRVMRSYYATLSAAAASDATPTPTGTASLAGAADTTAGPARLGGGYEPAHVDDRAHSETTGSAVPLST